MSKGSSDKTTTQTQDFKLPPWYEKAVKDMLASGKNIASGGYVPYIGPDVAAMAPQTAAGIQGTDAMSAAFGMPTSGGSYLPQAQEFAGGVKGYSSFPGFEQSMEALKAKYPGMYEFLSQFNKINQGSSYNPSQATAFQNQLNPQFNAMTGGPGGKGKGNQPLLQMAPKLINGLANANQRGMGGNR